MNETIIKVETLETRRNVEQHPYPESMRTVASYLRTDTGTVPPALFEREVRDYGTGVVDKHCFISPEYHRREVDNLWARVWQFACLEQDVANVGDYYEYIIADQSILVVRESESSIKAYFNACLHRGSRLKVGTGTSKEIRCGYHAWAWNLDGTLKDVPCRWDFPAVCEREFKLRECKADSWNGLVFINMDADAGPLEEFLGPTLIKHFSEFPSLCKRWKAAHVEKEMKCNWKIALEAFVEGYHGFKVHPQWLNYAGDANAQYDAYGLHSRMILPIAVPSPMRRTPVTEQKIVESMVTTELAKPWSPEHESVEIPKVPIPRVPEGATARHVMAEIRRAQLKESSGLDYRDISDSQMLDFIEYWVFPNTTVWWGEGVPLVYRARPNGNNPDACIFDVIVLLPVPEGKEAPCAAKVNRVSADTTFLEGAPELGSIGAVFQQDANNLEKVQLGLHSRGFAGPMFGKYMEMNIRQFHANLEKWVNESVAKA